MTTVRELFERCEAIHEQIRLVTTRHYAAIEAANTLSITWQSQIENAQALFREGIEKSSLGTHPDSFFRSLGSRTADYIMRANECEKKFNEKLALAYALEQEEARLVREHEAAYGRLVEMFEQEIEADGVADTEQRWIPASEAVLRSLPTLRRNENDEKVDDEKERRVCVICHEALYSKPVTKLSCAHEFHYDCAVTWLQRKNSCPLCRQEVTEADADADAGSPPDVRSPPNAIQALSHMRPLEVCGSIGIVLSVLWVFVLVHLADRLFLSAWRYINLR